MVCAEIEKQQQLKTLTQQLMEVKEGQSELSLNKSLVYMLILVGAMIRNF